MLPVPTLPQLATFTGRSPDTYGPFAASALAQATLLFTVRTRLTALPTDPDQALLAQYAILQMADRIYLEQPNATVLAGPFQSETIGSYSYSKGSSAAKAQAGISTGLYWWDLAIDLLTSVTWSNVMSGAIQVFTSEIIEDEDGNRYVPGPAEVTAYQSYVDRANTPI